MSRTSMQTLKFKNFLLSSGTKFKQLDGEGYIHQVDHDPAGLDAEAIGFNVTSCGEDTGSANVNIGKAWAPVWKRHLRLPTILFMMVWSSTAEISMSWKKKHTLKPGLHCVITCRPQNTITDVRFLPVLWRDLWILHPRPHLTLSPEQLPWQQTY